MSNTTLTDSPRAIAQAWLTGNGLNDSATVAEWLDTIPPDTFADECLQGWFSRDDDDTERPERDTLTAAFSELAENREWLDF